MSEDKGITNANLRSIVQSLEASRKDRAGMYSINLGICAGAITGALDELEAGSLLMNAGLAVIGIGAPAMQVIEDRSVGETAFVSGMVYGTGYVLGRGGAKIAKYFT